jgi:hypothetical protein
VSKSSELAYIKTVSREANDPPIEIRLRPIEVSAFTTIKRGNNQLKMAVVHIGKSPLAVIFHDDKCDPVEYWFEPIDERLQPYADRPSSVSLASLELVIERIGNILPKAFAKDTRIFEMIPEET